MRTYYRFMSICTQSRLAAIESAAQANGWGSAPMSVPLSSDGRIAINADSSISLPLSASHYIGSVSFRAEHTSKLNQLADMAVVANVWVDSVNGDAAVLEGFASSKIRKGYITKTAMMDEVGVRAMEIR